MAEYRIRDRNVLLSRIIPLFDQHLLLTSKYYNYALFKKALLVATNRSFTTLQKHQMLTSLRMESVVFTRRLCDIRSKDQRAQYKSFTTGIMTRKPCHNYRSPLDPRGNLPDSLIQEPLTGRSRDKRSLRPDL